MPRGEGIVTRCPLVLTIRHREKSSSSSDVKEEGETVVFDADSHSPELRLARDTDWGEEACKEILRRTGLRAGNNKNIVDEPIVMSLETPFLPDLELVDLPGFVNNPVGECAFFVCRCVRRALVRFFPTFSRTIRTI